MKTLSLALFLAATFVSPSSAFQTQNGICKGVVYTGQVTPPDCVQGVYQTATITTVRCSAGGCPWSLNVVVEIEGICGGQDPAPYHDQGVLPCGSIMQTMTHYNGQQICWANYTCVACTSIGGDPGGEGN